MNKSLIQRLAFYTSCLLTAGLLGCNTTATNTLTSAANSPWQADLGNGFYKNPLIHADYSDPDVIRVGKRYYMTSSSFNNSPGLPLMQSEDMVNWELVGHALPQQVPAEIFAKPQHGKGVWAPCLRYHNNKFWIFYPDPDFGIYVMTAENFAGPWSAPHLLLAGKGIIDPTPLWDEDGNAYLMHAWAKSRAGINNMLTLRKMSPDGKTLLDDKGEVVIDGNKIPGYITLEGPKLYKRNGYYYVFAPSGGVEHGWQSVFRAKNINGPYEHRTVLEQGYTSVNGPHQGAWVQTPEGSDWFFHFQELRVYGRIVHLQPMHWVNDWPVIGKDTDNNGTGMPVLRHKKPIAGNFAIKNPATTDEFSSEQLGFQWQWNANWKSDWYSLSANKGSLRLYAVNDEGYRQQQNLWHTPSLLLQKLPADEFVVETKLALENLTVGDTAGLIVYGFDYQWLGIKKTEAGQEIILMNCTNAEANCKETLLSRTTYKSAKIYLRMTLERGGVVQFSYGETSNSIKNIGETFTAIRSRWVGAQMGLFTLGKAKSSFVDVDYFRVKAL